MGMILLTLQKNFGVSIFYSYQDLAWTKHKFKNWFFLANTSTIFGKIEL